MKKVIKKIWGIGLVVVLLSSLFVAALPASAADYAFSADLTQPSIWSGGLLPADTTGFAAATTFDVTDVAQSGSTIYIVANDPTVAGGTGQSWLYKSADDGATWLPCVAFGIPNVVGTDVWQYVAVAPDDPDFVVVVNDLAALDMVYLSTDGGATFSPLTAPTATIVINDITVSYSVLFRYIAIGGSNAAATVSSIEYWTIGVGVVAPVWAALAPPTGIDSVLALEFSTNFPADSGLIAVTMDDSTAFVISAEVYSFNLSAWNPAGYNFPRRLMLDSVPGAETSARMQIVLDPNFYLGDEAAQIGFICGQVTDSALGEVGGIWRFDYGAGATRPLTKILHGTAINSIAWDGTNLMAGVRAAGPISIQRCPNALATFGWSFLPNSTFKTPGTGTLPLVIFSGDAGYCFSTGTNSGVAKTTDLGKSFNGVALLNTDFALIADFWISADGARTYIVADDGADINLWRKSGFAWERVLILAAVGGGGAGAQWMVRADAENPDTVYLALQAGTTMYKATDAGEHLWTQRACSGAIRDFAVQDKDIIYVALNATATVTKSSNGAFTWGFPAATGLAMAADTINSLTLLADDQLLVGGNAGRVAYSADGNATWSAIPVGLAGAPGATLVTASGLEAGDTIWAADFTGGAGSLGSWVIGTNNMLTGWNAAGWGTVPGSLDGLAYANGVLYVMDSGANLYRFLTPTGSFGLMLGETDCVAAALAVVQAPQINAIHTTTGSTTIHARVAGAPDAMQSYTEYLYGPDAAPAPVYPVEGHKIPVNSINGAVNAFIFKWAAPLANSLFGYSFDINIYLDEAGTILVGADVATGAALFDGATGVEPSGLAALAFAPVAGTTYYWKVRTAAGLPLQSYWSPMQSFTVQQLTAIVPAVGSPEVGASINNVAPAFSWSPIAGATMYKFELSTNAAFLSIVYEAEVPTAGAMLPTVMTLERGEQYYWRVKALAPAEGEWSTVANFVVAEEEALAPPPVVIEQTPAPVINIPPAPPATEIVIPAAPAEEVIAPAYIWAIIIIGAVLVIAVIVLIVRTRRSV